MCVRDTKRAWVLGERGKSSEEYEEGPRGRAGGTRKGEARGGGEEGETERRRSRRVEGEESRWSRRNSARPISSKFGTVTAPEHPVDACVCVCVCVRARLSTLSTPVCVCVCVCAALECPVDASIMCVRAPS